MTDLTMPKLCESCKCSFDDLREDQLPLSRTVSKDDVLMGSRSNLRDIGNNLDMGIKNNAVSKDYVFMGSLSNLRDFDNVDMGIKNNATSKNDVLMGSRTNLRHFGNVDMGIKNNAISKDYVSMGSLSNLGDFGNVDMGIKNNSTSKDDVLMGSRTNLRHFGNVEMGIKNTVTSKDDVLMGSRSNLRDIGYNLDMGIKNKAISKDYVSMGSLSNLGDFGNVDMGIKNNSTSKDDVLMGSRTNLRHFGNVDMGIKNNSTSKDDVLMGSRTNLRHFGNVDMGIKNNATSKDDVLMGSRSNLRDIGYNLDMGIKNKAISRDYVSMGSLSNLGDFGNSRDYVSMGSLSNLGDFGNVDMGIKNNSTSKDDVLMRSRTNLRHFGNVDMDIKNNATSKDDVLVGSRSSLRDIGNNLDKGIKNDATSKNDVLMGSRHNLRDISNNVNMDIRNNAKSKDDVLMGSSSNLRHFGNADMGIKNNSTSDLENCSIKNSMNENKETLVNSEDLAQCEPKSSLPIPDGLAMDPLSPTALAIPSDLMDRIGSGLSLLRDHGKKVQKYLWKNRKFEVPKKTWKSMVTIVLVEARDLPDGPSNNSNGLYCKFRLGNESHKSKQVLKSKPVWRERFNLHFYDDSKLEIIVWHKVKQKNFMGRCTIDLSQYERERTHDIWQDLDCGYGSLHLLVTLCGAERNAAMDNVLTTHEVHHSTPADDKYLWYRLDNSWNEIGQLSVTVHSAKGLSALNLSGNVDAYCILELDNSRVQTHVVHCTSEPHWNKNFIFAVHDITSTLDITVYDESIIQSMKGETLGKISIPLLRINNGEKKWYALKDRSKKSSAKGNCPRILLEMSLVWNPIKASFRVLSPKETKYVEKSTKFDIPLIYSNLKFIKNVFTYIQVGNDHLKRLFEWDNQEKSAVALGAWLIFWYFFRMWMTPLLLVLPFAHNWILQRNNNMPAPTYNFEDDCSDEDVEAHKDEKTLKMRIFGLQDLTVTIKTAIDYIVSLLERINNLLNFSVPYLSYLVMIALVAASIALYVIPINYIFMAFGIYKFTRKFLNPRRVPNNDILDFISRVPDNQTLKQWQELKVPEPVNKMESIKGR